MPRNKVALEFALGSSGGAVAGSFETSRGGFKATWLCVSAIHLALTRVDWGDDADLASEFS
jgi:hypothetical protein